SRWLWCACLLPAEGLNHSSRGAMPSHLGWPLQGEEFYWVLMTRALPSATMVEAFQAGVLSRPALAKSTICLSKCDDFAETPPASHHFEIVIEAMRKYWHVINIGIQNTLVYRVNFLFRALFGLIPLMAMISL